MTAIVNIWDAKTQLSRLVERAAAGEDILIAVPASRWHGWLRSIGKSRGVRAC